MAYACAIALAYAIAYANALAYAHAHALAFAEIFLLGSFEHRAVLGDVKGSLASLGASRP